MSARDRMRKRIVANATYGDTHTETTKVYHALYTTVSANARMHSAVLRRAIAPESATLHAYRTQHTTQGMDAAHDTFVIRFLEEERAPASMPYRTASQRVQAQRYLTPKAQETVYHEWLRGGDEPVVRMNGEYVSLTMPFFPKT